MRFFTIVSSSVGYRLSHTALSSIHLRYHNKKGTIPFDIFIQILVRVIVMFGKLNWAILSLSTGVVISVKEKSIFFNDNCRNSRIHRLISIVNKRTDTWIYNSCDASTKESGQFVLVKNKLTSVFNVSVLLLTMKFRHNIVKVVFGSTRLTPRGSTATVTLTMTWGNSYWINNKTDAWITDINV